MNAPNEGLLPLIRRPMKQDEWHETYLASVLRENGLRRVWDYHLDLARPLLPWVKSLPASDASAIQVDDGTPRYGRSPLPRWACVKRSGMIRYCPVCLLENCHVRARWRISCLPVCTLHGCHLKSDLAEPAFTWNYQESALRFPEIKQETITREANCCLPDELEVARAVWGPLEQAAIESAEPGTDDQLGILAGWTLLAWRLVEAVARAHRLRVRKALSVNALSDVRALQENTGLMIGPNQLSIQRFLAALPARAHYRAALNTLSKLMSQEAARPSVLSQLPLATLQEGLIAACPHLQLPSRVGDVIYSQERSQSKTRREVARELGIGERVMSQLLESGALRQVERRGSSGKPIFFIGNEEVREVRRFQLSLVEEKTFVSEHDVDRRAIERLRRSCILTASRFGVHRYLDRRALSTLATKLELVSSPVDGKRPTWTLFGAWAIKLDYGEASYENFIRAAIDGKFIVYRDRDKPSLSAFSVGADAVLWFLERSRVQRCAWRHHASPFQLELAFV